MSITINGEIIDAATINAAAREFASLPDPVEAAARTLALRALLRQRALIVGIVADDEEAAIEALLEREVAVPAVSEEECRRMWAANRARYRNGDLFEARHILLEAAEDETTTDLEKRAEDLLLALRERPQDFAAAAERHSTCPSARQGGHLGQISRGSLVPELWQALLAFGRTGLIPEVLFSRYGRHLVLVERAALGEDLPYEAVAATIRVSLDERMAEMAYRRYVSDLAAGAAIGGIDLIAANAPAM